MIFFRHLIPYLVFEYVIFRNLTHLEISKHDLEILCDTIDMWFFQFTGWSTITPKNFTLVILCIASLCKMTSPWGFRFFFLDIINI